MLAYGGRTAYGLAFLLAAAGVAAAMLYRYADIPAFGPIPSMYEPVWFTKKVVVTAAEAVGAIAAAVGGAMAHAANVGRAGPTSPSLTSA